MNKLNSVNVILHKNTVKVFQYTHNPPFLKIRTHYDL